MGCQAAYKPAFCDVVNVDKLECKPTDVSKPKFDISTLEAIGYRCVSPKDWSEGKKRLRESIEIEEIINEK